MKTILLILNIFTIMTVFICNPVQAQQNSDWKPVGLAVTGKNVQQGVEAYYQISKCGNEDVIFVRFINNNSKPVKVEWNDGIFNSDQVWLSNSKINTRKTLNIEAFKAIEGSCNSNVCPELVLRIKDFTDNAENVRIYRALSFHVQFLN